MQFKQPNILRTDFLNSGVWGVIDHRKKSVMKVLPKYVK